MSFFFSPFFNAILVCTRKGIWSNNFLITTNNYALRHSVWIIDWPINPLENHKMPESKEKSLVRLVANLQGEENESIWIDSKRIDNRRIDADLPDVNLSDNSMILLLEFVQNHSPQVEWKHCDPPKLCKL